MLLGNLLARFEDESVASALSRSWRRCGRAEADGETVGVYAAALVWWFAAEASDETWITLMGALARAEDPGAVCLKRALAHGLEISVNELMA